VGIKNSQKGRVGREGAGVLRVKDEDLFQMKKDGNAWR